MAEEGAPKVTHPLDKLTDEQTAQIAQGSCDMQMETLREAEKEKADRFVKLLVDNYGDVLKRLAKE